MLQYTPSLGLLNPFEYFVTVNHSGLWQRHVAWAKPDGKELRTYISSQYSTNMVLLSLLLGIQNNVFFNSSPEMVDLRQTLTTQCTLQQWMLWGTADDLATVDNPHHHFCIFTSLKFWIGFLMLLNICVTIMGILATFTTWSMISAISDRNAHCLLRSSMGQYVTTLSPRLVVASVYLFALWFLLFVVELVAKSNPLLWILLLGVAFMFFSIVVPLSVFGRLILHTGAMAERPVLSEDLETELLPNGLYASLVIRAHHRQRKNTSVTNQYRRQHHHQQQDEEAGPGAVDSNPNQPPEERNPTLHFPNNSDGTMFASDDERIEPFDDSSLVYTEVDRHSSMGALSEHSNGPDARATNRRSTKERSVSFDSTGPMPPLHPAKIKRPPPLHKRLETTDTTIDLPPAAVLNMSMTGKEFKELINNAMDTSSIGDSPGLGVFSGEILEEGRILSQPLNSTPSQSFNVPSTYRVTHTPSSERAPTLSPSTGMQHHRRRSSSRFLLHEWAQESSIRDLYGIAPPAEIPPEITISEGVFEHQRHAQTSPNQNRGQDQRHSSMWSPRRIWDRASGTHSGLSSEEQIRTNRNSRDERLDQPLLPTLGGLENDDTEELGDTLLGEDLLPPSRLYGLHSPMDSKRKTG